MIREQAIRQQADPEDDENTSVSISSSVIQLDFVKSALTVNPCMVHIKLLFDSLNYNMQK